MEFLENFVKNLDVTNFIIVIFVTIILTLSCANYFKIGTFALKKNKKENLEDISKNEQGEHSDQSDQSECDCSVMPVQQDCDCSAQQPAQQPVKQVQQPKSTLSFYYAEGCGYCTKFKPEWFKIKNTVANSELATVCDTIENDCAKNPAGCKNDSKYIQGFPTVLLTKGDGSKIVYTDYPRTHNSVLKFLQENM